jgi:hypothetical protein
MMDLVTPSVTGSDGNALNEGPEDVITSLGISKFDLDARALGLEKCVHEILEDGNCDCILLNIAQEVV